MIREIKTSITLLIVADTHIHHISYIAKRCFDIVAAGSLLVLLAPLMLMIALMIRLDSRGPALFVQQRVGSRRVRHGGQ